MYIMELRKKVLFVFLLFALFVLLFNIRSYAGTQKWNALDYDVSVNSDGSMDVIETWDISISETNTLFKDFELDTTKYSGISDVKVSLVENGVETPLKQIYQEQYHVTSGCYYGLQINYATFEIAWNVGLDNSSATRTYKIYYKVKDAVKIYNDCTELYWMFLSTNNGIGGKNITGTIKLPGKVTDIEKLRVWAHGDLSGEIQKKSNDEVVFSLPSLSTNQMLEVRIVTEENVYEECTNVYDIDKLSSIMEEEQKWADEANAEREQTRKIVSWFLTFVIGGNAIIILFFFFKIRKYIKIGKKLEEEYSYPKSELEYFREIPNEENATPARAAYLYEFNNNASSMRSIISRVFSATILDLCLKGLVEFEPIDQKEVRIMVKENKNVELTKDEKIVYDILVTAIGTKDSITTKEFSNYARANYNKFYVKLGRIQELAEDYHKECGNLGADRLKVSKSWRTKKYIYITMLLVTTWLSPISILLPTIYIGVIAGMITCSKNAKRVIVLSEKGYREQIEWKALKRYMENYSLLKEKTVPDIVLWEKFLVYATVFGISKRVIKQLKVIHPEMFVIDNENYGTHYVGRYTYWNIISDPRFGEDYFSNFSMNLERVYDAAQSAYNIAHSSSSSGSGGGGGFSGGSSGGGRRRRWKLWRSLKYIIIST